MKYVLLYPLLALILSGCGSIGFMQPSNSIKLHTNIKETENMVSVTNLKGYSTQYSVYNGDCTLHKYGYRFLSNDFTKKKRSLIISHPDYISDTINIDRSLRPLILGLDILGFCTIIGSPAIVIDFANGNMWRIKKKSRGFNLSLKYNDAFYDRKLKEIEHVPVISSYKDYIIEYPKSPYIQDAYKRIYEIAYDTAVYYNTVESFQGYIVEYPNSHLISEAKDRKDKVKEMDDSFANAKKEDNPETYESFLKKYPISIYSTEIKEGLFQSYYRINSKKIYNLNEANNMISEMKKYEDRFSLKYTNPQNNLITNERDKYTVETLKSKTDKISYWSFLAKQYELENGGENGGVYDMYAIKNRAFTNRNFTYTGKFNLWNLDGSKEDITYKNSIRTGQYIKYDSTEKVIIYEGSFKDDSNATGEILILTHKINFPSGKKHFIRKYDQDGEFISDFEFDEEGNNITLDTYNKLVKEGDEYYSKKDYPSAINSYNRAKELTSSNGGGLWKIRYAQFRGDKSLIAKEKKTTSKYQEQIRQEYISSANSNYDSRNWYAAYTNYDQALKIKKDNSVQAKRNIAKGEYDEEQRIERAKQAEIAKRRQEEERKNKANKTGQEIDSRSYHFREGNLEITLQFNSGDDYKSGTAEMTMMKNYNMCVYYYNYYIQSDGIKINLDYRRNDCGASAGSKTIYYNSSSDKIYFFMGGSTIYLD